jgi:serine/threonine-protein kinase ULK/ATG1
MKLYDVYENKALKIMIIEYCNGGTLARELTRRKLSEAEAIEIIKQLITGLSAMHQENIIHRDLKPENIMSHNGVYKIIDLGFARTIPANSDINGTILGTIVTMAPEVIRKEKYGLKADIWSIGVIFYEMIYGQPAYKIVKNGEEVKQYHEAIKRNIFPDGGRVNGVRPSQPVLDLLKRMIVVDQQKRIDWGELIQVPILQMKESLPDQFRIVVSLKGLNNQKMSERSEDDYLSKL